MANAGYRKGSNAERDLCKMLRREGGYACRTAGSHSSFDVIHLRRGYAPRLIQLKRGGSSPFQGFGPRVREAALLEARGAGGNAVLCWWPDRGEPQFIGSSDWP